MNYICRLVKASPNRGETSGYERIASGIAAEILFCFLQRSEGKSKKIAAESPARRETPKN
ncbi:hypothetical protein HYN48_04755 [Flavobacterium magnum]|uniref:Uncharacterized protein n=1 Tax=Flavobacterium magnum TaxID=2162713 RepID=A0A2S0RDS7_9FLAO|nr:hypothetical protein HYN48_04755 [Flavobacterium magnum]